MQYCRYWCSTVLSTAQYSTVLSTVQYRTVQYSTVQYSTVEQYSVTVARHVDPEAASLLQERGSPQPRTWESLWQLKLVNGHWTTLFGKQSWLHSLS